MARSRRLSSRSTAARMKSACFSLFSNDLSMRFRVPAGNLADTYSSLICLRPIFSSKIVGITY